MARSGTASHRQIMRRFLAYGALGLGVEALFTSIGRAVRTRDLRLSGTTYLWMLPIYGAGGLLLERLHARLIRRGLAPPVRALVATGAIYAMEYGAGSLLRSAIGECPWRYERGLSLRGYVRLDYAPYWYGAALLFEMLQREIGKLDRPRRRTDRRAGRAISERAGDADGAERPLEDRRRAPRRKSDRVPAARAARRKALDVPFAAAAAPAPDETASA
jgi:hypothetical protein